MLYFFANFVAFTTFSKVPVPLILSCIGFGPSILIWILTRLFSDNFLILFSSNNVALVIKFDKKPALAEYSRISKSHSLREVLRPKILVSVHLFFLTCQ